MLSQHLTYKHATVKPWKCDECHFAHATKRGLNQHKNTTHAKESRLKMCHLCTFKSLTVKALQYHIEAKHEKIKRFSCDQCDRKFYFEHQMKRHVKSTY